VRKKRLLTLIGSVCLALMLAVPLVVACAPKAEEKLVLTLGTGAVGGSWFPMGAVVASIINENVEGIRIAPTVGGAVSNLKKVDAGEELQMAITNAPTDMNGWNGQAPFERQYRNARGLWMNYPEIGHIYTLAEANIKSVADLKGKRVSPMYEGSTGFVINQRVLAEYGMTIDDFAKCELIHYSGGADLMKDKHLDAYMINTMPPNAAFLDVCTFTDVVVLGHPADIVAKLCQKYPDFIPVTIPAGAYPGNPDPIDTYGYMCGFTCNKELPEDFIYQVVSNYWPNYESVLKVNPGFKDWIAPENALRGMVLPLHPGAYRYYKEQGYEIPDKIMPID
jgi:TRAP transporter TAXI family solute receptor